MQLLRSVTTARGSVPARPTGKRRMNRGFTLIEVLVALVVISIGLLGLLALQIRTLHSSYDAYLTSVANIQAMDLEERIRANRGALSTYKNDVNNATTSPSVDCASQTCSPGDLANYDVSQWLTTSQQLFPGTLSVALTEPGADLYKLKLDWQEPDRGTNSSSTRSFNYMFRMRAD